MKYIPSGYLFESKRILIVTFLFICCTAFHIQAQQQVITFIDHNVRTAILEQYGEGELGVNNGARQINGTDIDFSKLYSISDPANAGVNGVTSLVIYPGGGLGALNGVELLPRLSELTVSGYNGLLIPDGIVNLPLKILDLSSNGITTLPANFSNLTLLENLNVSINGLTGLPSLPSSLIHLVVDHNQLSFKDLEPYVAAFSSPLDYGEQIGFISSPETIALSAGQTLSATAAGLAEGLKQQVSIVTLENSIYEITIISSLQ